MLQPSGQSDQARLFIHRVYQIGEARSFTNKAGVISIPIVEDGRTSPWVLGYGVLWRKEKPTNLTTLTSSIIPTYEACQNAVYSLTPYFTSAKGHSTVTSTKAPTSSPLPLELRHQINTYLLVTAPIRVHTYQWLSNPPRYPWLANPLQPTASSANRVLTTSLLLLLNPQIHTEASAVLYSLNIITFEHPEQLTDFRLSVPATPQARVRSIELVLSTAQADAEAMPTPSSARRVVCAQEDAAARCQKRMEFVQLLMWWAMALCNLPVGIRRVFVVLRGSAFRGTGGETPAADGERGGFADLVEVVRVLGMERRRGVEFVIEDAADGGKYERFVADLGGGIMSSEEVHGWLAEMVAVMQRLDGRTQRMDRVAGLFRQAADTILDEIVAEDDVDAVTDDEGGQGEGESLDEGSESGEEELDVDGDEVTQRFMGDMFAEEGAKEIGEYGCRDEDDSLMEEMEQGDFGEVPEDDQSMTDKGGYLDEL